MRKAAFYNIILSLGMFLAGALPAAAAPPRYTWLDLNTVNAPGLTVHSLHPRGISQAGEVAGYGGIESTTSALLSRGGAPAALISPQSGGTADQGFLYRPPTVGEIPAPNAGVWAQSIGGKDWAAGRRQEPTAPYYSRAFSYNIPPWGGGSGSSGLSSDSGGTNWDLGDLGGTGSWANGVNAAGQVVGGSYTSSGVTHAFLYSGGVMQDLLPAISSSEAYAINNAGQVVGVASAGAGAFLWSSGGGLQDLGALKPPYNAGSTALAINDAGQVVGYSSDSSGNSHAFLWSSGSDMVDLGALPGGTICQARGINNTGQVVGYSASSSAGAHAFLYSGGVMYDLNSLVQNLPTGVVLSAAYGINDRGQIIADGGIGGYSNHGYILTPIVSTAGSLDLLLLQ
jgi:probable HAF family extracellular repeat protein